jgi:dolichol-phosphate mannosyltransferase
MRRERRDVGVRANPPKTAGYTDHAMQSPPLATQRLPAPSVASVSVVAPVYNEEGSIDLFCQAVFDVLEQLNVDHEVIIVDDGSSDRSFERLIAQAVKRPRLKVVQLRRNFGQTAALMAGIDHASKEVIVLIDADLQNDPRDIPRLLGKIAEGYDIVSGWRKDRQDPAARSLLSRVANRLISRISGVALHDYGCTLKAYRGVVIRRVRLYGEMHRFVPIFANAIGARITEIPVTHHPRRFGRSKYGFERIWKVLLDLLVVQFLQRSLTKPIYVFGAVGLVFFLIALTAGIWALVLKFGFDTSFILTPLPLISVMGAMLSAISILMGLLAEIIVRTYFEAQGKRTYTVGEVVNMPDAASSRPS